MHEVRRELAAESDEPLCMDYEYSSSKANDWFTPLMTEDALKEMVQAERLFDQDSINVALNGSPGSFQGLQQIVDEYGNTEAGNLARFKAASSYYKLGDYASAVKLLEDFDPIEKMTYSLDPLKDLQAFHDFFNVEVKIPENEREFNEKLLCTRQISQNPYPIRILLS